MGQVRGGDPQKQLLLSNVQMLFRILIKKVAEKKAWQTRYVFKELGEILLQSLIQN